MSMTLSPRGRGTRSTVSKKPRFVTFWRLRRRASLLKTSPSLKVSSRRTTLSRVETLPLTEILPNRASGPRSTRKVTSIVRCSGSSFVV